MGRGRATFPCPACHADVPEGALACRACGADARTGWGDDEDAAAVETAQELDLPETSLSDDRYDEFVREELEGGVIETSPPSRTAVFLVLLVVLGVAALLALVTSGKK